MITEKILDKSKKCAKPTYISKDSIVVAQDIADFVILIQASWSLWERRRQRTLTVRILKNKDLL